MYSTTFAQRFELILEAYRNETALFEAIPASSLHEGQGWKAALSGSPLEPHNSAMIYENRNEAVDEVLALFEKYQVASPIRLVGAGQNVLTYLESKNHTHRYSMPLMTFTDTGQFADFKLRDGLRVELFPHTEESREKIWSIYEDVYQMPQDQALKDGFKVFFLRSERDHSYALYDGDELVSMVTVILSGETVGIWGMGTPQAHQKKGYGAELLRRVIQLESNTGKARFILWASEAGEPLYKKLGWQVCEYYSVFGAKEIDTSAH